MANVYNATSWFENQLSANRVFDNMERRFLIGASDYTDRVISWPVVKRTVREFKSQRIKVKLSNHDGGLNYILDNYSTLQSSCTLQFGLTHPTSGTEYIDLYNGKVHRISFDNDVCVVHTRDKFFKIEKKEFTTLLSVASYFPPSLAWVALTSYGLLDNTASTSNIDIDYTSFLEWSEVFSTDNVYIAAVAEPGVEISDFIKQIFDYTDSSIWISGDNKLHFKRFSDASSLDFTLSYDELLNIQVAIDTDNVINDVYVDFLYNTTSRSYAATYHSVDTTSVNSFDTLQRTIRETNVWWANSVHAGIVADRIILRYKDPPKIPVMKTGLNTVLRDVGDTLKVSIPLYDMSSGSGFAFNEQEININDGAITYRADQSLVLNGFRLDFSTLDGTDLLL